MSEVLIDDSSLNAIAHSIRRKNGLLRTYKPREMAPAIRAFNDFVPDAHSFTINVQQSPHQTIRLRKYLDADYKEYTNTFTISEPFYKADIIVEADAGYEAGKPNYVSPITIDRDMVINASPAIPEQSQPITIAYINGNTNSPWWGMVNYRFYSDPECAQEISRPDIQGKLILYDVSNGYPLDGGGILGHVRNDDTWANSCSSVIEVIQDINTSLKNTIRSICRNCHSLVKIDASNWSLHLNNVTDVSTAFSGCENLLYTGDISGWYLPECMYMNSMFAGDSSIKSIDLHDWYIPNLTQCEYVFDGCTALRFVDISGLTTNDYLTTCYGMFRGCSTLRYIIMDRNEVMFQNYIFDNPNNTVKYLVPSDYVNLYKEHANWQSRASQIDSIDNYTITRYGGQVFVTPNN